jgi:hypothetical protein
MWLALRNSSGPVSGVIGLATSILPAAVAHAVPKLACLEHLGAVVLGGLAAIAACQPRRNVQHHTSIGTDEGGATSERHREEPPGPMLGR